MDILFWKNLSNKIVVENATKQFYRQYLYKLELDAPGCKSIHHESVVDSLDKRSQDIRNSRYGGSWWDKQLKIYLNDADPVYLEKLQWIKHQFPNVKLRTQEPYVTFYAYDEKTLKDIISKLDPKYYPYIKNVTGPKNNQLSEALASNATIVRKPPKYRYKVWFREKQFEMDCRNSIMNYLTSLDSDLVRVPDNTYAQFRRDFNWIWSCYFYTNDLGVVSFIQLMGPDIIREVSEQVCLDNK